MNRNDTTELKYKDYGTGYPLLIIHGMLGSGDNWAVIAQELSDTYHVLTPDMRNHGDSPRAEYMDFSVMAGDVADLAEQLKLGPSHVIGHSMGAKIALQLAVDHPSLVRRLVLVDASAREYGPRHVQLLQTMLGLRLERFSKRSDLDRKLSENIGNPLVRAFLLKGTYRREDGTLAWRTNIPAIAENYRNLGAEVALPSGSDKEILVLRGERSDYVSDEDIANLRRSFPRLHAHTIADAGHWVHFDAREEFLRLVREFLTE